MKGIRLKREELRNGVLQGQTFEEEGLDLEKGKCYMFCVQWSFCKINELFFDLSVKSFCLRLIFIVNLTQD